jgi:hypothetical protein
LDLTRPDDHAPQRARAPSFGNLPFGENMGRTQGQLQPRLRKKPTPCTAGDAQGVAGPCPADDMVIWPVDKRIGKVRNNDPALIG